LALPSGHRTAPRPGRVTVLAAGAAGWPALCRLVTTAHGAPRGRPVVDRESVGERAGLVVLLGPDSDVGRAVAARRDDVAERLLREWAGLCPGRVVSELVDRYRRGEHLLAARMLELARRHGTPAVLSNA